MNLRLQLLRWLSSVRYFRGRNRLNHYLAGSFVPRPVRLPSGLWMYLDPFEYVQLEILIRGAAEPQTLALIRNIVGRGACVIDVGAHIGHHVLEAAAATGSDGRVFAFDPQP